MQQKCSKIVLVFHIIAFELVAVSSPYYYENNDNFAISFFYPKQNRQKKSKGNMAKFASANTNPHKN